MYLENKEIKLSKDNRENILSDGEKYYQIDYLIEGKYVHGGNGFVFKLTDEQEGLDYVVKFLKFPEQLRDNDWKAKKRIQRFEREVEAMFVATNNSLPNVVRIFFNGTINIDGMDFHYYVMEKCDFTLKEYLIKNGNNLDITQKSILCQKILKGILGLHEYKIYHRDIKQDNVYFIGNEPYIGDLGLADYRDTDIYINERGELIGPTGWFSPEAINKYLVEKIGNPNGFDCTIDEKSEIFQLGKLFWYIFQGNIPIGHITLDDFLSGNNFLFTMISNMLKHSKKTRFNGSQVENELNLYLASN
jgi:serine/threonine protein kinase